MAKIIYTDGREEELTGEQENGGLSLDQLSKIVGGLITTPVLPDGKTMVANDEGLLIGLPVNIKATMLYNGEADEDVIRAKLVLNMASPIVGDVIICQCDDEGELR